MMTYSFLVFFLAIFLRCLNAQEFNDIERCTMRSHGDPHVETCNDNGTDVTCYAPGMQTYFDIYFLRVQAFHTKWTPNVTIITEILIEFKSLNLSNAITYIYRASKDTLQDLPSTFEHQAAEITETDSVDLIKNETHVVLEMKYAAVIIVIGTWKSILYQFTMRASRAVMNTGNGILIDGCPLKHIKYPPGGGKVKREKAKKACLENGVPAFAPDMRACIFDVMFFGNISIAAASQMAITDRTRAISSDADLRRIAGSRMIQLQGAYTDLQTCTVVNPCDTNNGGCAQTCTYDSPGASNCTCGAYYTLDPDLHGCTPVNPCDTNNGGCAQTCRYNSPGASNCICGADFTLDADLHGCTQVPLIDGIKLVGGEGPMEGRVEVLYQGIWGTVCDDYFDINAARVVCRILGYPTSGTSVKKNAFFGRGTGRITLDNVQCTGSETSINNCQHSPFLTHNCGHHEDVGVTCGDLRFTDIRRAGSRQTRVEVRYQGIWGTVCDDFFDDNAAKVVCRMLNPK